MGKWNNLPKVKEMINGLINGFHNLSLASKSIIFIIHKKGKLAPLHKISGDSCPKK